MAKSKNFPKILLGIGAVLIVYMIYPFSKPKLDRTRIPLYFENPEMSLLQKQVSRLYFKSHYLSTFTKTIESTQGVNFGKTLLEKYEADRELSFVERYTTLNIIKLIEIYNQLKGEAKEELYTVFGLLAQAFELDVKYLQNGTFPKIKGRQSDFWQRTELIMETGDQNLVISDLRNSVVENNWEEFSKLVMASNPTAKKVKKGNGTNLEKLSTQAQLLVDGRFCPFDQKAPAGKIVELMAVFELSRLNSDMDAQDNIFASLISSAFKEWALNPEKPAINAIFDSNENIDGDEAYNVAYKYTKKHLGCEGESCLQRWKEVSQNVWKRSNLN